MPPETWAAVDQLKANVKRAADRSEFTRAERARRDRNLVWRHYRKLPVDLATAVVFAWRDAMEPYVWSRLGTTAAGTSVTMLAPPIGNIVEVAVAADWLREHGFTIQMAAEKPPSKQTQWRPMTEREVELALGLAACRFSPGSFEKRFARDLGAQARSTERLITRRQAALLERIGYRYRRQLGARGIAAPEKPPEVPHGR